MKIINIYIMIIALLVGAVSFGQDVEFKKKNFKDGDDAAFKTAVDAIKEAEPFFTAGSQAIFEVKDPGLNFKKALQKFEIAQKFNPDNAQNNFRIGVCYLYSTSPYKGIPYIEKANQLNPACDPFMSYYFGYAMQLQGKFSEALEAYKKFEDGYKKADNFNKFTSQHKKECDYAKKMMADPVRCWIDNVEEINSEFDEIAPTIVTDASEIIFSSNRPNSNKPNEVGDYDYDIYISYNDDGKWEKAKLLPGSVNSSLDDIVNNLSYDGTRLLLHKDNGGQTDIYESELKGANWGTPVIMPIQISSSKADDMYGSYNHDGYNIYFARGNRTNEKGTSIMTSGMQSKMQKNYGTAVLVGEVSSLFNDGPVYLHIDGKTMYIASQGHESLGGYDIFISKKVQGSWTKPVNMGYPINTAYDDFFFAATANGKFAYISSNRPGGKGGFDIYKVTFWGAPKKPILDMEDYLLASIAKPIKDPKIEDVVDVNKISLTVFKGKTIDDMTEKPVEAQIDIIDNKTGSIIEQFTTNSATGKFLLSLTAGKNYGIAVKANGYLFHSENFDIPDNSDYNLVDKTIRLKNIKIGSKIALRNIFFDTGKSTLRPESNAELDRLVKLLKDVPSLKVEISGHTDNTGSASINDQLSQDRADAVVNYLKTKGIAANRLTAKGYGSNRPIASNATPQGKQENRRTEFEIIGN